MIIGNVCPARVNHILVVVETGERRPGPFWHEPAEDFDPVLAPFHHPVWMQACKHCGALYVEIIDTAEPPGRISSVTGGP